MTVTSFFSPHANAAGKFVGFLGEDAYDNSTGKNTAAVRVGLIGNLEMNVLDASPVPTSVPVSYTVPAGTPTGNIVVGNFNPVDGDLNAANYQATVYWGDGGVSQGTVAAVGSNLTVSGNYTYTEAFDSPFIVYVGLQHAGGGFSYADNTTLVVTSPPIKAHPVTTTWPDAILFSGPIATVSDPDLGDVGFFQVAIQWGDKSSLDTTSGYATGGDGQFTIFGTHAYLPSKLGSTMSVQVTVVDPWLSDPALSTSTFIPAALKLSYPPLALSPSDVFTQEGQSVSNQVVATFIDPFPNDPPNYSANIDWGDGSPRQSEHRSWPIPRRESIAFWAITITCRRGATPSPSPSITPRCRMCPRSAVPSSMMPLCRPVRFL